MAWSSSLLVWCVAAAALLDAGTAWCRLAACGGLVTRLRYLKFVYGPARIVSGMLSPSLSQTIAPFLIVSTQ